MHRGCRPCAFTTDDTVNAFFSSRVALLLTLPIGAALALAFAPFGWWPLSIACPAYLFAAWLSSTPQRAAKFGFLFTAGTFLAGTYWIYHSVHVIGNAPVWIAIVLMLGLVAIMGGYTAALGYALARWLPSQHAGFRALLVLPAGWTLLEWFRGWFLTGFPWLSLGYAHIDSPLAAWAPLGGVYCLSLIAALTAGALLALLRSATSLRVVTMGVLAIAWGVGLALWNRSWTQPSGHPTTVAIVQGAVPQDLKWSPEYRDSTLALYRTLTLPHLGKDIVVWPEAALPDFPENIRTYLAQMWGDARTRGTTLITGLLRFGDGGPDDVRNGLLVLDEELHWYDKRRLVPFGEWFPVPSFVREWMRLASLPYSDITPGAADQPALPVGKHKIGTTICYEDAYGSEQLQVLREATLLVNVTNDAWFGDSTAAPQHLEISRMRALEAGRPLLRAANDGISAIINPLGAVSATLPRFQPGVLTGVVQPHSGLTPYARTGNYPVISLTIMLLLLGVLLEQRSRRIDKASD